MPFISRLKKLGTLPVPVLQTTLTVYLINLEYSEETNLVYTSSSPIPADATPPADLRYECPEGYTQRGDVLIWASRVHKKACFVHACWVFDGDGWVKPSSDSEVMMDHPVHSDYQLVILSGPYIKWELKPDPDREPSLSVPDPPPLRLGARGSMNSIHPSPSLLSRQNTENTESSCPRPRSSDIASDTPDGSAAMCSSSRSSTPLSDIPEDEVPELKRSEPPEEASSLEGIPKPVNPSLSPPLSGATEVVSTPVLHPEGSPTEQIPIPVPPTFPSAVTTGTTSFPRPGRERPKGARSMSSQRDSTPVPGAPPTPDSSLRTRTRRYVRPDSTSEKSKLSPLPRRRKRNRPVDDDDFVPASSIPPASATTSHPNIRRPTKRRKLGLVPPHTPGVRITLPPRAEATKDEARNSQDDSESDGSESAESFWDQLEELQREKDILATQVKEAADIAAAHSKLVREAKYKETLIEELHHQLALTKSEAHGPTDTPSLQARLAGQQDKATKEALSFERWSTEANDKQTRMQHELDTANIRIRVLEKEKLDAEASLACTEPDSQRQLSQLRSERDRACRIADDVRAELTDVRRQRDAALLEAKDSKRAANDSPIVRTNDITLGLRSIIQLEDQRKPPEADHIQSQRDINAPPGCTRSEGDKPFQMQSQVHSRPLQQGREDIVRQLEEQKRRATNFETSLRVAQEALHRQRTHAQETEVLQRRTITQLARELQEKDQIAKELATVSAILERRVAELQKSLVARDNELKGEKDAVRRAKAEMEQIKHATQADRLQIAELETAVASSRDEIIASNDKSSACQRLVDQIQQEKKACDDALADEARMRVDFEARLLESQCETLTLRERCKDAEDHFIQERRAKYTCESRLEAQRILFLGHLSISDRERGRLEELLLEQQSSLQLDLRCKVQDLESVQAEYAKSMAESSAEREQLHAELSAYIVRQAEATKACERMESEVRSYKAELIVASASREQLGLEVMASESKCERLNEELCETRNRLEKMMLDSEEELAEGRRHRQQLEDEFCKLQLLFHSQARYLESAKAECLQLKTDATTERKRLTSQLSSLQADLEEQRTASQKQLAAVREEHKSAQEAFQDQRGSLEREACRVAELLKASQGEIDKLQTLFRADRGRFETELSSTHKKLSSLESLLANANQERYNAERLLAEERLLKEQTTLANVSRVKELEDIRADLLKSTADLDVARQQVQDTICIQASMKQELAACQQALATAEEAVKREQDRLVESRSIAKDLEESRAECSRLMRELSTEREGFHTERSLSPDSLRSKLSSVEARLENERTTSRSLRKQLELAQEESSNYWSDLGSQLLRSLHEVQDQLKVEQNARQALQEKLELEQSKNEGLGTCEPLQNNA